jgi:hypothetical protein
MQEPDHWYESVNELTGADADRIDDIVHEQAGILDSEEIGNLDQLKAWVQDGNTPARWLDGDGSLQPRIAADVRGHIEPRWDECARLYAGPMTFWVAQEQGFATRKLVVLLRVGAAGLLPPDAPRPVEWIWSVPS